MPLPAGTVSRPWFQDAGSPARSGLLADTARAGVPTPAFMPVGTQATVKGLTPSQIDETGTRMLLANTYHLALRPGEDEVAALGGLHSFMGWKGPILTDSGGFQVFSLSDRNQVTDHGVTFRSHLDGSLLELTPERAMAIQEKLGSDVAMCLDHCPRCLPRKRRLPRPSLARSPGPFAARRPTRAPTRPCSALFRADLMPTSAPNALEAIVAQDFDGYAIGGVSVGEGPSLVRQALHVTTHLLPADRPRYLMGVGRPQDILDAVATGVDLFDCVMPTRNGRNATCFSDKGYVRLRNASHRGDSRPIEENCTCLACREFSRVVPSPPVPGQGDAGPDPGDDPQPDLSASPDFSNPRSDRGGSVCPVASRSP